MKEGTAGEGAEGMEGARSGPESKEKGKGVRREGGFQWKYLQRGWITGPKEMKHHSSRRQEE